MSEHHWYVDLVIHGGYYFFATLVLLSLRLKWPTKYQILAFFGLSVALELLQLFSFNRCVDLVDIACNATGILAAWGMRRIIDN